MSRPRANFYKIDRIEYEPVVDRDLVFIAFYVALTLCAVGFWLWCVLS